MNREEIERKMDELAREYYETLLKDWITERASLTPDPPPLLIWGFLVWRVSI
jgi:hypothetical protein